MLGAVLLSLNTRLDSKTIAFVLNHSGAKAVITDVEFSESVKAALPAVERKDLLVIDHVDSYREFPDAGERLGSQTYEEFIAGGDPAFAWKFPRDEWDAIALNYTSGTTADPKGVVLHHRGAYLNTAGNCLTWALPKKAVYLWTLPMFHCNGWCFPWTICAVAGVHVCLRKVDAGAIFKAIADHKVTHLCGAPIVMQTLINYTGPKTDYSHQVSMMTAASAPPAAILAKMDEINFKITHVYGLTEVYGPAVVCEWHDEWDSLSIEDRAVKNARQGVLSSSSMFALN
jgi:fatty-acyl-CoA synthase